jgi:hypothetical protein
LSHVYFYPSHYCLYIKVHFLTPGISPWRQRQQGCSKHWYPTTLTCITTQKTSTWIFTALKTSNLAYVLCEMYTFV